MANTIMIILIMTVMKGQHSTIIQYLKLQNPIMFKKIIITSKSSISWITTHKKRNCNTLGCPNPTEDSGPSNRSYCTTVPEYSRKKK